MYHVSKEAFDKINVQVLVCIDRGLERQHQQVPPVRWGIRDEN